LSAFDPTATLAVHCGKGFDAGRPYAAPVTGRDTPYAVRSITPNVVCLIGRTSKMKKCNSAVLLLVGFAALAFVVGPTAALAKKWDHPDSGICKSGVSVAHVSNCKENGGKK
jgi:hypothetical protein